MITRQLVPAVSTLAGKASTDGFIAVNPFPKRQAQLEGQQHHDCVIPQNQGNKYIKRKSTSTELLLQQQCLVVGGFGNMTRVCIYIYMDQRERERSVLEDSIMFIYF